MNMIYYWRPHFSFYFNFRGVDCIFNYIYTKWLYMLIVELLNLFT